MEFRRFWKGAVVLLILLAGLTGCARREKGPSLWVVTERTEANGMNGQVRQKIDEFLADHPKCSVRLDILPEDKTQREMTLKQLRSQVMGGKGPDVFLLPTMYNVCASREFVPLAEIETLPIPNEYGQFLDNDTYALYPMEQVVVEEREPLFRDVAQIMENGLFADLSPYYDADETLGRENLHPTVMEAGTYRGKRYILPLRFDFPVLYADVEKLGEFGMKLEELDCNILDLMDMAIASGDRRLAASVEPFILRIGRGLSYLPQTVDYETDQVLLRAEDLAQFFRKLQALEAVIGPYSEHRGYYAKGTDNYRRMLYEFGRRGGQLIGWYDQQKFPRVYPMRLSYVTDMPQVRLWQVTDEEPYDMRPVRNIAGGQTAYVTYYGAVGAGSSHPAEAYELLRLFLTEDAQFELTRPFFNNFLTAYMDPGRVDERLIEDGWPVRVGGSGEAIWTITRHANKHQPHVRYYHPTNEDFPLLATKIDCVTFGSILEQDFAQMVRSLNDQKTGQPTDVDIDALAAEFIRLLRWQVMEG